MKSEVEVLREALDLAKAKLRMLEKYSNIGNDRRVEIAMEGTLGIAAILSQPTTPSREERLEEALELAKVIIMESNPVTFKKFYAEIDSVLNPAPEYEEVEISRWELLDSGCKTTGSVVSCAEEAAEWKRTGGIAVKLTGTIKREKPRKVQRRVSVDARVNGEGYVTSKTDNTGYTKIAFWHEDACKGKTGTLTFTWEEQP